MGDAVITRTMEVVVIASNCTITQVQRHERTKGTSKSPAVHFIYKRRQRHMWGSVGTSSADSRHYPVTLVLRKLPLLPLWRPWFIKTSDSAYQAAL